MKNYNKSKKSQSWSMDLTLGILVFMGAFFIFYVLLNANQNTKVTQLKEEASAVSKQIASKGSVLKIISNNQINESRLNELKNINYDDLKASLRTEGDFCLYLEDEKGNIILINNSYRIMGAPTINLSGIPCSQK